MKEKIRILGEAERALSHPIVAKTCQSPQEIQGFSGDDASAPCPSCNSTRINLVRMPEGLKGKKISPKQQEVLARIEVKVGVKG